MNFAANKTNHVYFFLFKKEPHKAELIQGTSFIFDKNENLTSY